MRSLTFTLLSVLGTSNVQAQFDGGECTYAPEILQVQDASSSFEDYVQTMINTSGELVDRLVEEFVDFKFSVASFVDKPIPLRGLGAYGNNKWYHDFCFKLHSPMSGDLPAVRDGLQDLMNSLGSGGDYPESPYDGLIEAAYDDHVLWTDGDFSPNGRPINRIAIVITDDVPHMPDQASTAIAAWNFPRTYNGRQSTGGFGAHASISWARTSHLIFEEDNDEADYTEMCDLFANLDLDGPLTPTDETRLDALIAKFGPYPYPEPVAHPGDNSIDCTRTEYPTLPQVGAALRDHNITPIFIVAQPGYVSSDHKKACDARGITTYGQACLKQYYEQDLVSMGVDGVVLELSDDVDVVQTIINAVKSANDLSCLKPTTSSTEPSTTEELTEPSTTEEVTEPSTTGDVTEPTTTEEGTEPTTTEEVTEPTTTEEVTEPTTTEEQTDNTNDTSTADDGSESTQDNTDSSEMVSKSTGSTEESNGSTKSTDAEEVYTTSSTESEQGGAGVPIGTIAGATGGAIAGVAAVGALLYKTVGFSMFSSTPTADVPTVNQVETTESPLQREIMEEVTMDMFQ